MAVTPTYNRVQQGDSVLGPWRAKVFQMSVTGTYVTGGIPVAATDIGIGHTLFGIILLQVITQAAASGSPISDVEYVAGNLVLISSSTGLEVAPGNNMATGVYQLLAFGY